VLKAAPDTIETFGGALDVVVGFRETGSGRDIGLDLDLGFGLRWVLGGVVVLASCDESKVVDVALASCDESRVVVVALASCDESGVVALASCDESRVVVVALASRDESGVVALASCDESRVVFCLSVVSGVDCSRPVG
jgi:hypothetical protein